MAHYDMNNCTDETRAAFLARVRRTRWNASDPAATGLSGISYFRQKTCILSRDKEDADMTAGRLIPALSNLMCAAAGRAIRKSITGRRPRSNLLFDLVSVIAIASAAVGLHHGLCGGARASRRRSPMFGMAFFAVWWAWMNFTWFASAYDNDDTTSTGC